MSEAAFALGRALDPTVVHCSTVPNCPLCGEDTAGDASYAASPGAPGHVPCPHCGDPPPGLHPATPLPIELEQQLLSIRDQNDRSQALVDELAVRNAELIRSRGDFMRVQDQINEVRQDMIVWQNETKSIHGRLRDRDLRRSADLERINNTLATIAAEADL